MQNIAKLLRAACASCPVAILALACSGGGDDTGPSNASGSGRQTSQGGIGGAAGGSEPLPEQGGSGGAQAQPGAGGSTAGSSSNGSQAGAGGSGQADPAPEGEERWHCTTTMQGAACSCVLATSEPVAPFESGCPDGTSFVCCYTSDTFNPDDACSCWTESGLMQLGQTCEELVQVVEAAGATRVDSCSND